MFPVLKDRKFETSTTTGSGAVTLSGTSATTYSSINAALADGDVVEYTIIHTSANEWEAGRGRYTASGTTLSRDTIFGSSNANAAVSFSAGTKNVIISVSSNALKGLAGNRSVFIQTAHGFAVGDWMYYTGSAWAKAKADAESTAECVGVIVSVSTNYFELCSSGLVEGLSGLTAGTTYFLSTATAGAISSTDASSEGHVSKPLLLALSTTSGITLQHRGVLVSTAGANSSGKILQVIEEAYTSTYSTTSAVPYDNTKPQSSEGAALGSGVPITPISGSNKIEVSISLQIVNSATSNGIISLYKDSDTDPLYTITYSLVAAYGMPINYTFPLISAASTTARTYKLRYGPTSGTMYINRDASATLLGNAIASRLTVKEVSA